MNKMIATKQEREKVLDEVDGIISNLQDELYQIYALACIFMATGDIKMLKKLDARFTAQSSGVIAVKSIQDVIYKYIYNNGKEKNDE